MTDKDDIAGWIVRVTVRALSGGEGSRALYAVAQRSPDGATAVVRARDKAVLGEMVEVVDRLSSADIQRLGLKHGQVMLYESTA